MGAPLLTPAARIVIEIALTAHAATAPLQQRQEAEARALGICGAEIDAARAGRSFDAVTARMIDLARAIAGSDHDRRDAAWSQARNGGMSEAQCRAIAELAAALSRQHPSAPA